MTSVRNVLKDGSAVCTPGLSERRGTTSKFYCDDALGSTGGITNMSQAVTGSGRRTIVPRTIITITTIILFGLTSLSLCTAETRSMDKAIRTRTVLSIVHKLDMIAHVHQNATNETSLSPSQQREIVRLVDSVRSAKSLDLLQQMCLLVQEDRAAEDAAYDSIFVLAFWHCVERLANDTSPTAVVALHRLAHLGTVEPIDFIVHYMHQQEKLVAAKAHHHK